MKRQIMSFLVLGLLSMMCMGSRCQNDDPMDTVRNVHVGARSAFERIDETFAPMLEGAGLQCQTTVDEQGLEGQEGYAAWQTCMQHWMRMEAAVSTSRELFQQLELIYDEIEAGQEGNADIHFILRQVVAHGLSIIRAARGLGLGEGEGRENIRQIVVGFERALEEICNLVQCDAT
jgi:hypothetical protein